jgi:hypothetical protein
MAYVGPNNRPIFSLTLRDDAVKIRSISIEAPLVATRNTFEGIDSRFSDKNLEIWSSMTPGECYPGVVSNSNDKTQVIRVKLTTDCAAFFPPQPLILRGVLLPSKDKSSPFEDVSFQFQPPGKPDSTEVEAVVTVPIRRHGSGAVPVPWGIKGSIKWSLLYPVNPPVNAIFMEQLGHQTPIELYGITPNVPTPFKSTGIPRDLLRIHLLPVIDRNISTIESWVEWVTQRCFNSQTDTSIPIPNSDNDDGTGPIHRYRYDIFRLSTTFSYFNGATFDLDQWLRHRQEKGKFWTLNCYDQAAIVETSVSLGVPYDLLQWRFMRPFGYLPGAGVSLVGWGKVNTTTGFAFDPSRKMLGVDDDNREGFGNHAFLTMELPHKPSLVLDACAGPQVGKLDLDDYCKVAIDQTTKLTACERGGRADISSEGFIKAFSLSQTHISNDPIDLWEHSKDKEVVEKLLKLSRTTAESKDATFVDLTVLFATLWYEASEKFGKSKPEGKPEFIMIDDMSTPNNGAKFGVEVVPYQATVTWTYDDLLVSIDILNSHQSAVTSFKNDLRPADGNLVSLIESPKENPKGQYNLVEKSDGSQRWVRDNRVIQVTPILSDPPKDRKTDIDWLAQKIDGLLKEAKDHNPVKVGPVTIDTVGTNKVTAGKDQNHWALEVEPGSKFNVIVKVRF